MMETPFEKEAAIIRFSVPVWLGKSRYMVLPVKASPLMTKSSPLVIRAPSRANPR